jgi:Phospholipase_D-nuclease N-terminal
VDIGQVLAIAIPLIAIQLTLIVLALRDLMLPERRVRGDNKLAWGAIIILGELLGPLLYFAVGREAE